MSAPPRHTTAAPEQQQQQQQQYDGGGAASSAPRSIPGVRQQSHSSSGGGGGCHQQGRGSGGRRPLHAGDAAASPAGGGGSSPHVGSSGSSPGSCGGRDRRQQRYGRWPPQGSSPAGGGGSSFGSRQAGSGGGGRQAGGGRPFSFTWPPYMDRQQLQQAMKRGQVFRAKFRVNAANRSEGFCTLEGLPSDLLVRGDINQNRAVEGDEVAVLPFKLPDWFTLYRERDKLTELGLLPQGDADPVEVASRLSELALASNDSAALAAAQSPWTRAGSPAAALGAIGDLLRARPDMRVTGKVVAILEPSPRRNALIGVLLPPAAALAAGTSRSSGGGGGSTSTPSPPAAAAAAGLATGAYEQTLMLVPLDPRLPRGVLTPASMASLPQALREEASALSPASRTFVSCRMADWPAASPLPLLELAQRLGPTGDIEAGTAALLAGEGIADDDFSLDVYACLPAVPWSIPADQLASRADFSSWRIFSIDPPTARDLDDALSIQALAGGGWRVGVHIADVASFVPPGSPLDEEAARRGTSVYLVQRVIPMLPRLLCEQLCSLQPGEPRCAFSIVWELDDAGNVLREWAGRSVIDSVAKLSYPMVQAMIDGAFDPGAWPAVSLHHDATWEQVLYDCLALHGIASHLRAARFASGALRLDNTRLCFALDAAGNPASAAPYVTGAANHLVEEFMLLANMRVAGLIAGAFPTHAVLRRHTPPNPRKMGELQAVAELLGGTLDASSAGALGASLAALKAACPDKATAEVVELLATKPMQLATYFCTGESPEPHTWRHYALAVDMYTHFTSPIRRYPDILVHRLLAAALELAAQRQHPDGAELLTAPVDTQPRPPVTPVQAPDPAEVAVAAAGGGGGSRGAPVVAAAVLEAAPAQHQQQHQLEELLRGDGDDAADELLPGGGGSGSASGDDSEAAEQAGVAADADAAALLARHELPGTATLAKLAKHCNDTKVSARNASDGSLKLYLCIMLRKAPLVTWAVVDGLGGDRFVSVYLPALGCETRLHLHLMGVPLSAAWSEAAQVLLVNGGSQVAAQQRQWQAQQQQQQQQAQAQAQQQQAGEQGQGQQDRLLNRPEFDLRAWLDELQRPPANPDRVAPVQLPLQVRMFTRLPVVVSAYTNSLTCHPEDLAAKLWLDCGARWQQPGGSGSDAPTAPAPVVQPSVMDFQSLTED